MTQDQLQVLNDIIDKYGIINQLDMCIEECAELIQAINKVKRSGIISYHITKPNTEMKTENVLAYANLCSEVADVKIMLAQLELMLNKKTIDFEFERKLNRIKSKLY